MTIDLTGKIALVTGGGNGIGAASCRALATSSAPRSQGAPSSRSIAQRATAWSPYWSITART